MLVLKAQSRRNAMPRRRLFRSTHSTIITIGDSITEYGSHVALNQTVPNIDRLRSEGSPAGSEEEHGPGWVALLARDYAWTRRADVINRGFGGYNTRMVCEDIAAILPAAEDKSSVIAVTVGLGANDHIRPEHPLHVPVAEFESNLTDILAVLGEELPNASKLLVTPPPADERAFREHSLRVSNGADDGGGIGNARLAYYVEACTRVAAVDAAGCQLVNVHDELMRRDDWSWDGLHLSSEGNAHVYALVADALARCGRAPVDLPMNRPHWLARVSPDRYDDNGCLL